MQLIVLTAPNQMTYGRTDRMYNSLTRMHRKRIFKQEMSKRATTTTTTHCAIDMANSPHLRQTYQLDTRLYVCFS